MSLIDTISINKSLSDMEIMVGYNKRKQPCIYICDTYGNKVLLKQFFGKSQYRRWLLEAVVLYLATGSSYRKHIKEVLSSLNSYFKDKQNEN